MHLAFIWLSFACAADGVDDADDEEAEDEKPKTRKEKQQVWDLVNDNKAIWLRKPSEVTPDEYQKFYKAVSKVCA
jgi:heat shock protein beta